MAMFLPEEGFDPGKTCRSGFPLAKTIEDFSRGASTSPVALFPTWNAFSLFYRINNFFEDVNKKVKCFPQLMTNYLKYI